MGNSSLEQRLRMVIRDREQHIQRLQEALQSKRRESLRCAALEREVSHDKKTEQVGAHNHRGHLSSVSRYGTDRKRDVESLMIWSMMLLLR